MKRLQSTIIFVPSLNYGGAEISMSRIADYLTNSGIKLYLVVAKSKQSNEVKINNSDTKVIYLNSRKTLFSIFKLQRLITKLDPDIILSTLPTPNFVIVFLKFFRLINAKVVVREAYANYLSWDKSLFNKLNKKLSIFAFKHSDGNIFISNELKENVHNFIVNQNSTVIYNPVFTHDFFGRANEQVSEIDKNKILWVTSSRLEHQKGLDLLFDAIEEIQIDYDFEVLVLGSGSKLKEFKNKYKHLPITFVGNVTNPLKFLNIADLFLFPSRGEGLGNSLIEAEILGLPIISSDCPTGPKEIVELFSNGVLFESENKQDLKRKLSNINYKKTNNVREEAINKFAIDIVGKKYLTFFEKLLNEKSLSI